MAYTKYYPSGWKNSPDTSTPIIAAALENIENGLVAASSQINGVAISGTPSVGQVPTATSGSNATWQSPQPGFLNPMTTLGDIIYEDGTPAAARLPGNAATTRKFLRQKGTGAASAAPAWDTFTLADIAVPFPYRFYVDDPAYGAVGDGKVVGDVSTTNASGVITSATAAFTANDVGKTVMINGAVGTTSGPLVTTIASYQSATQVTLTANATQTATNCSMVWGTNDQAAIQSAIDAANTYAQANNFQAEVVFGAKIYMLTAAPTQTGNGTSTPTFNTQLKIPNPDATGNGRKLHISFVGAAPNGSLQYFQSTIPSLVGTCLVSTRTAPATPDATFGKQSVIGGPTGSAGFGGGFANVRATFKGIQVIAGAYTNLIGIDLGWLAAARVDDCSVMSFCPTGITGTPALPLMKDLTAQGAYQATIGTGIHFPVGGNNADTTADNVTVAGLARSFEVFDHFTAGRLFSFYSDVALRITGDFGGSGSNHAVFIQNLSAEVYNGGIKCIGGNRTIYINLDAETSGTPAYDISGTSSTYGELHFTAPAGARTVVEDGANPVPNLKIVDDNFPVRGLWSGAPALPASTVASTPIYRDTMLQISGGTVTQIAIDNQNTGLTAGVFFVPSGKTYKVTYSVAPTRTIWTT